MDNSQILTVADFKAEKQSLQQHLPDSDIWKGLALWINTFVGEHQKRVFYNIWFGCYEEELLKGGKI